MKKKFMIFVVLTMIFCLALPGQAVASGNGVVTQNVQTIKMRSDAKDHFKSRSINTFRGNGATNINRVALNAFSPQKAPSTVSVKMPNLIGSVVQSNEGLAVGMYSISENGLTPIKTNYTMNASNGGAALDGRYICCFMDQYMGQVYGAYYRIFEMSDWSLVEQNYQAEFNLMAECMTSDGSDIYGCFYKNDLSGYELGTMSLSPVKRTGTICSLATPYIALACDTNALYGIYGDGRLVKINKSTGEETDLSNIGIVSSYLTSAAYDSKTGILYYASCTDTDNALYAIDFNNGYSVSKICDLKAEVCGMHIIAPLAEEGAPAAVTDLAVSFEGASLSGSATFTMPTVTFGGGELTGNLEYKVLVNGEEGATGNAAPGASISTAVNVAKADMYKFTVVVSNDIGDSPSSNVVNQWIGPDKPFAPENVGIVYNNGVFNVSWASVVASENNGYFDAEKVTYTVIRYNNGAKECVVADGISTTQYEDAVAEPEQLSIYTYRVVATFEGTLSNETKSNAVVLGSIIPPYSTEFATSDDFQPFSVIDSNSDYNTWGWNESGCVFIGYSWQNDMDDWLMSAPVKLEAGKAYRLSFDARGESEYYKDHFEVKIGNQCNVEAMETALIGVTELTDATYRTYYALITPKTTGTYYIGIHCLSKVNMGSIYIDNFAIESPIADSAPAIVENVKFTAQPDGSSAIDVSFKVPAQNIAGEDIASITYVKVIRDNEEVKKFTDVAPGAVLTFKDMVGEERTVHYTIVVSNEFGEGVPYDSDAYCGLKLPATPTDCKIIESATVPGQVTVTWNPLAQDEDGDAINSDLITYTMVDINEQIVATGLTAEDAKNGWTTNIEIPYADGQALAIFYIFAENRVGRNPINGFTQMIPVGGVYEIPFKESCPQANLNTLWMHEGAYWSTAQSCYQPVCMPQDDDQGMFYLEPFLAKENNLLLSGKISIPESDKVGLSFYYCGTTEDLFDLVPTVRIPGGETYYLTEPIHTNSIGTGWQRVFVSLAQFSGMVVQVGVNVNARSQQDYFLLDNIEVREFAANDVAVVDFIAPATMTTGVDNKVAATITNLGTNVADNVVVQILSDDVVVDMVNIEQLNVATKQTIEFTVRPAVTKSETATYKVKVVFDADEDTSNNESEAKNVEYVVSQLPTVTISGTIENSQVILSWDIPDTESKTVAVTDDIEAYESFAIGKAGNYTFFDLDGDNTFGLEGGIMFENQSNPMSYIVFDVAGIEEAHQPQVSSYAHSGSKCFASFASTTKANDDWLISPELPGSMQTISFWTRSANVNYGYDQFEILYSTTGNSPEDFVRLGEVYASNLAWSKIEAELPEGSKYFAIRCISYQTLAWLIDDISYTYGTPSYTVVGYNVYRDGVKLNDAVVTENVYVDVISETRNHSYNVTAVYAEGESRLSNTYDTTTTGVDGMLSGDVLIRTGKGVIIVNGASDIAVYSIDGKTHGVGHGNATITVKPGFYVVKADDTVTTVAVH